MCRNEEETRQRAAAQDSLEHGTDNQDISLRDQIEIKRSLYEKVTYVEMGPAHAQADRSFRGLSFRSFSENVAVREGTCWSPGTRATFIFVKPVDQKHGLADAEAREIFVAARYECCLGLRTQ